MNLWLVVIVGRRADFSHSPFVHCATGDWNCRHCFNVCSDSCRGGSDAAIVFPELLIRDGIWR